MVVCDPQKTRIHSLASHIVLSQYYNTGFGDPKVGRDPPIEKHWCKLFKIKLPKKTASLAVMSKRRKNNQKMTSSKLSFFLFVLFIKRKLFTNNFEKNAIKKNSEQQQTNVK